MIILAIAVHDVHVYMHARSWGMYLYDVSVQ